MNREFFSMQRVIFILALIPIYFFSLQGMEKEVVLSLQEKNLITYSQTREIFSIFTKAIEKTNQESKFKVVMSQWSKPEELEYTYKTTKGYILCFSPFKVYTPLGKVILLKESTIKPEYKNKLLQHLKVYLTLERIEFLYLRDYPMSFYHIQSIGSHALPQAHNIRCQEKEQARMKEEFKATEEQFKITWLKCKRALQLLVKLRFVYGPLQ